MSAMNVAKGGARILGAAVRVGLNAALAPSQSSQSQQQQQQQMSTLGQPYQPTAGGGYPTRAQAQQNARMGSNVGGYPGPTTQQPQAFVDPTAPPPPYGASGGGYPQSVAPTPYRAPNDVTAVPMAHSYGTQPEIHGAPQGVRGGFVHWSPVTTTLGTTNGVGACLRKCVNEDLLPSHPTDAKENCCYWTMGQAITESLARDILCCIYCGGYFILRLLTAFLCGPLYCAGMTISAVIMIFPTLAYFFSQIVCSSKNIGPVAKIFFSIGFPILTFISPATVCIWSLWHGIMFPFQYCFADSFTVMLKGPTSFITYGLAFRKQAFAEYNSEDDWRYEIGLFAPLLGLLGIVVGLCYCLLACTLLSLLLAPRMFAVGMKQMWSAPYPGKNDTARATSQDPFIALCQCCINSAADCCVICTVMMRVFWSFVIFIGAVLWIPWSVLLGGYNGVVYGAQGYWEAGKVFSAPHEYVIKYIADTKEHTESQNCGGTMY